MHNETMTWTKDVMFKMPIQYGNAVLVNGLKLYGILLVSILTIGLMIILVLAMGKITVLPALNYKYIFILILVMMNFDKIAKIQRFWERFWNGFVRILTKKVSYVFGKVNSKWIQTLFTVVYYLAIVISAFLLTRDRQEESYINTEMEVSQFQKNIVEALFVFLFFCI